MTEEDFRCPFCRKETQPLSIDFLHSDVRFSGLTDKQIVRCEKHNFLLFGTVWIKQGFFRAPEEKWQFKKTLKPTDFICESCIYWNLKKGKETKDGIDKTCELGLQKGKKFEGFRFCDSCEKFEMEGVK